MGRIVDSSEALLLLGLGDSCTDEERAIVNLSITQAETAIRRYLGYDPVQASRTEYYPQTPARQSGEFIWESNESIAYVRQLNESATSELIVQHLPIRSHPAIDLRVDYDGRFGTQAGSFAAGTLKVEGTDFWPNYQGFDSAGYKVCRDGIIRSIGLWPTEAGCVKIIYTGGYTAAELRGQDSLIDAGPIWDACLQETIRKAKGVLLTKKNTSIGWLAGPITSENLGDYSYTMDSSLISKMFGSSTDLTTESKEKLSSFINWGYNLGG